MVKFKVGEYIKVKGKAHDKLIGATVQVKGILSDCYLIDLLNGGPYMPWKCTIADANAELDKARTVLYGD